MASPQVESHAQLHIFFLPYLAVGKMIPIMHMARLFASRGVKSSVVTTPGNVGSFAGNPEIDVLTIKFPSEEAGLPQGCENAETLTFPDMLPNFFKALDLLQHPFENLVQTHHPNCLVVDELFSWANASANKFRIPCLGFSGISYFSQCIIHNLLRYQPFKGVSSDSETFLVPGLPDEIRLTKSELSPFEKREGPKALMDLVDKIDEAKKGRYGIIINSFYELEPAYADYFGKEMGIKHWHIGPLSRYFTSDDHTGRESSIDVSSCIKWLDEKQPESVVYVCFGSFSKKMRAAQLHEIAIALEALGQNFIFVVKEDNDDWVPHGLEERVHGQGLIIRGWAPQNQILNHSSVGGFLTHCGWNSLMEGVSAGLPLMTWPLLAEQFYNEKLITHVLKIGIEVGAKNWIGKEGDYKDVAIIGSQHILKAMKFVMVGEEGRDMRKRAKEFKELTRKAMVEGGSSYSDLNALIDELKSYNV